MVRVRMMTLSAMALAAMLVVACGGGATGVTTGGTTGGTTSTSVQGQYVDAPTAGLRYSASPSGLIGTTDVSGYFQFVPGDTVTFSVTSADGSVTIPMGTITPPAPAASASTAVVSVLSLPNGHETAQAIQSFATGGSDFRSVQISRADADALRNYITSGGVTTPPTAPNGTFISKDVAVNNALQYIANLSTQPVASVNALLSGKTFFSVSTFTASNGTVFPNANIIYFAPNGAYHSICINTIFNNLTPNPCATNNGQPLSGSGTWAVANSAQNTFTLSGTAAGPTHYVSTITAPIMDGNKGYFSTSQTNDGTLLAGLGAGKYEVVQDGYSITSLVGQTFTVSGFGSCMDGLRRYVFGQIAGGDLAYGWTCPGGYAGGAVARSGVATNASVAGTTIPGVVALTDEGSTDPWYVGISVDSSNATTGIAMMARVGNSGSGCSFSTPGNCTGSVRSRTYTKL